MASERLELRITGDASGAIRALERMQKKAGGVGQKMKRVGRSMTMGVTAPILGVGAAAVKVAAGYESSMKQVEAVTGATGGELKKLEDQAKELGRTTQFSASQSADAMYFLASAGFDTAETMEALPGVLDLAAAGNMDLASAADIASNVLSGYGMEASELGRVNDTMAKTFQKTNTNIQMLGDAFKYVGPVANSAGVDFNETAAAIGLLGNAGIQADMAGTSLRNSITKLLNATGPAEDVIADLGLTVQDAEGNFVGFESIVRQLEESGATTSEMMQIFGQRAGPAMAALVEQGADAMGELKGELDGAGGTAKEVAEKQMEGLNGAIKKLKSALEGMAIAVAESGLLDFLTQFATKASAFISKLAEANPVMLRVGVIVAALVAAIGPLLWILGSIITSASALAPVFAALLGPVGLAIAAVAALGFALYMAWTRSERFRNVVMRVFAQVKAFIAQALQVAREVLTAFVTWATGWWERWGGDIVDTAKSTGKQLLGVLQGAFDAVAAVVTTVVSVLSKAWELFGGRILDTARHLGQVLVRLFRATWENVKQIVDGALRVVRGIFDVFAGIFTGDWSRVWDGIKGIVSGAWSVIHGLVSQAGAVLRAILSTAMNAAKNVALSAWDAMVAGVKDTAGDLMDMVRGLPGEIVSALGDLGSLLWGAGRDLISGLLRGITSAFGRVRDKLRTLTNMLPDWKGPAETDKRLLADNGQLLMDGLVRGIDKGQDSVKRKLQDVTSMVGSMGARPSVSMGASGAPGAGARASRDGGSSTRVNVERLEVRVEADGLNLDDPEVARRAAHRIRDALRDLELETS